MQLPPLALPPPPPPPLPPPPELCLHRSFLPTALLLSINLAQPGQSNFAKAKVMRGPLLSKPRPPVPLWHSTILKPPIPDPAGLGTSQELWLFSFSILDLSKTQEHPPTYTYTCLIYTASLFNATRFPRSETHARPLRLCLPEGFLHTVKF